jgi:hypothetical protein
MKRRCCWRCWRSTWLVVIDQPDLDVIIPLHVLRRHWPHRISCRGPFQIPSPRFVPYPDWSDGFDARTELKLRKLGGEIFASDRRAGCAAGAAARAANRIALFIHHPVGKLRAVAKLCDQIQAWYRQ